MSPGVCVRVMAMLAMASILPAGFGQSKSGAAPAAGSTGTSTGTTGTSTTTTTPTLSTTPAPTTTTTPPVQQPIYVSGRVVADDGSELSGSVLIERVCGSASPHAEGYTDSKGYFSIEVGRNNNGMLQDASEGGGGFGRYSSATGGTSGGGGGSGSGAGGMNSGLRFANCDLRASLAGYRSQTVSLGNRRPMDNPEIGVLLLHRLAPTEGSTISASSLNAPKEARKFFEKGQEAVKKQKLDDAMRDYEKAVEIYPGYATAWYELGTIEAARGGVDTAMISLECSIKADPKYVPPLIELSGLYVNQKKWKEVAAYTARAASLDAFDYPQAYFYNAVANYNLRNYATAEKSVLQAEKLDTRHEYPRTAHLRGLILAQRHDYAGAAEALHAYLKLAPDAPDAAAVHKLLDLIERNPEQAVTPADQVDH